MRILLIEDDPHVRGALSRSLAAHGHAVTEGGNVRDGLDAIESTRFDLLLLDINLPDATGWDILRAKHFNGNGNGNGDVPAIVISAIPPSVARLREFRPFAVLHKPFPVDSLIRLVEKVEGISVTAHPGRDADD